MTDSRKLPYLIKLLDDESISVRKAVFRELESFGPSLEEELSKLKEPLDTSQMEILQPLLEEHRRTWLNRVWPQQWQRISHEKKQLEKALSLISQFQLGRFFPHKLKPLLDQLAAEYRKKYQKGEVLKLALFLFQDIGFSGSQSHYSNPRNSNLICVVKDKRGSPLSLTCLYILVANRLRLTVEGCDFPGHFLSLARKGKSWYLVDCFHQGKFLGEKDLLPADEVAAKGLRRILHRPTSTGNIIQGLLWNLIWAYNYAGDIKNSRFMFQLFKKTAW